MRHNGPTKLDIEIKSDWLLFCFIFVTKALGFFLHTFIFKMAYNIVVTRHWVVRLNSRLFKGRRSSLITFAFIP